MEIGPLQLIVIGFAEPDLAGEVLDQIEALHDHEGLQLLDLLAFSRGDDGEVVFSVRDDLSIRPDLPYGAFVAELLGLAGTGETTGTGMVLEVSLASEELEYGLDVESIDSILEDVPIGGTVLVAVVEHRWAIPLRAAIGEGGGLLVAQDFISPEALLATGVMTGEPE
ncbi:MAG: hypothetical protein R6X29_01360 [Acidimicrobiia bacterium]|jgi:uncharacterized membrane protein